MVVSSAGWCYCRNGFVVNRRKAKGVSVVFGCLWSFSYAFVTHAMRAKHEARASTLISVQGVLWIGLMKAQSVISMLPEAIYMLSEAVSMLSGANACTRLRICPPSTGP